MNYRKFRIILERKGLNGSKRLIIMSLKSTE